MGATLRITLTTPTRLRGVFIRNGFQHRDEENGDLFPLNSRASRLLLTSSTGDSAELTMNPRRRDEQKFALPGIAPVEWVELEALEVEEGGRWRDLVISDIRLFKRPEQ